MTKRTTLQGAWTLDHASRLRPVLVEILEGAVATAPPLRHFEIDVTAVEDIDACGCQLLALFAEHLKLAGIAPLACGASRDISDKIRTLGFDPETLGMGLEQEEARA